MSLRSDNRQWGSVAKFFHWIVALGILGNGVWGLLMTDMSPSMSKINVYALHKSIGLTILALFLLRVAWRLYDRAPPDEPAPRWQRIAAHATHVLLYFFILALPLSGWMYNSLHGYPLQWFKLFNLPALAAKNDELAHTVRNVHEYLFYLLLLVLIGHVGAALKHHVFDRDNVLRRMLPFGRVRSTKATLGELP
ncbi:cytochrome b [Dyella caseinilytica]|uniref:Cytochrome b n=1 Tax=Dyella caseinilytica TaxID=1849581 RepID=A0ABX7GQX8_9GAMM|nr:cytochrome b [Dyella caseinilytica]QRN52823.1 cytochrome b [Dyella caseinilytica]GGA09020.1 cytochrome b [Dyella caseinilytica]